MTLDDDYYMDLALAEAKKAYDKAEVPIGAVLVDDNGEVVATGHNMRETWHDATAHAELIAIQEACRKLQRWRLSGLTLYVTIEPCPMCAWAVLQAGIKTVYFGSYNLQYGAMGSVLDLPKLAHSKVKIYGGIQEEICDRIIADFFKKIRQ